MSSDLENPFPAMNPWLEEHWRSVNVSFFTYICDQISDQLPTGLAALTEGRVLEEDPEGDVLEGEVERSIHIVAGGGELITSVEILSPSNKSGKGLKAYRDKQQTLQEGGINLVEIDLIRKPDGHVLIGGLGLFNNAPYKACMWRASEPKKIGTWAIAHSQQLPKITIPLRDSDPDAIVDLQKAIDETFRRGRYAYLIDYNRRPVAPVDSPHERKWLEKKLTEKGQVS